MLTLIQHNYDDKNNVSLSLNGISYLFVNTEKFYLLCYAPFGYLACPPQTIHNGRHCHYYVEYVTQIAEDYSNFCKQFSWTNVGDLFMPDDYVSMQPVVYYAAI